MNRSRLVIFQVLIGSQIETEGSLEIEEVML